MDKRNINVLVQSIKRSLHVIYKNRFQLNNRNSNKFGLKCSYFRANECIFALLVHGNDWVFFRNEQQKVYSYCVLGPHKPPWTSPPPPPSQHTDSGHLISL